MLLLAGVSAAHEPDPEAVLAELPFLDGDEPNRIYIDLAPEGHARRMRVMLDTGATFSAFTPQGARDIGVKVRRTKETPYRRKTLLGRDLQFYIDARSSDTGSKTRFEYGLLGGNFLAEYVVEIDFPGRRVRFLDHGRYEVPKEVDAPGEAVVRLNVVSSRPGMKVSFNGKSTTMLLDTGAPSGMMVSGKFAKKAGISSQSVPGYGAFSVLGPVEIELGEAKEVAFGPFAFEDVPVEVAPNEFYNLGFPGDSLVGYDILSQFVVRIDYRRRRMWLKRDPDAVLTHLGVPYEPMRRSGLAMLRDGGRYVVYAVLPGSLGERCGVRAGDIIESHVRPAGFVEALEAGDEVVVVRDVDGVPVDVPLRAGEEAPEWATQGE